MSDEPVTERRADPPVAATTTAQQDLTTAGQRTINLKWESTQQTIAISVTLFVLSVCTYIIYAGSAELKQAAFIFLTNLAFLVVGTYFQRTNHTKTGGVGPNETTR